MGFHVLLSLRKDASCDLLTVAIAGLVVEPAFVRTLRREGWPSLLSSATRRISPYLGSASSGKSLRSAIIYNTLTIVE